MMTQGDSDARTNPAIIYDADPDHVPTVAGPDAAVGLTQAQVERFGDDVLCGLYLAVGDEVKAARDRFRLMEWEIRRRLAAQNATVIGEKYALILRPGAIRSAYLTEWLEALKEHIGVERWDEIMRPSVELNPDKRALTALAKRGGEIAEIIRQAVIETRGPGKLERTKQ